MEIDIGLPKPLRSSDTPIKIEIGWRAVDTLVSKIKSIISGGDGIKQKEHLNIYNSIFEMCMEHPDQKALIYKRYKDTLQDYMRTVVLPSLRGKHGEILLRELVERWKNHKVMVRCLSKFFRCVDKFYVKNSLKLLLPLPQLGISCFFDMVFNNLKSTLAKIVISMIEGERDGNLIDRALVKDVLDIYVDVGRGSLGLYKIYFEDDFLEGTSKYYSKKAQAWMLEDSLPEYIFKAEECLQKEKERAVHYLHSSTEPKLLEGTLLDLIARNDERLLNMESSGFKVLLIHGKSEELSRINRLFSKIGDSQLLLLKLFKEHCHEEGMSLLKQVADDAKTRKNERKEVACSQEQDYARKAIELHKKYKAYATNCFENRATYHKGVEKAFRSFLNQDVEGCSITGSLAAFCDNILRRGGIEKLSDEAVEEILDKVVDILKYIFCVDLFIEFYRKKLANRLLVYKSVNHVLEKSFVSKLKLYRGRLLTYKLEPMLSDMTHARENQTGFEAFMRDNNTESVPALDLNVSVLKTGLWPSFVTFNINLPSEMINCVEVFKEYYMSKYSHRKLKWIYSLGHCNLSVKFDNSTIELVVSTYQAALLLLFNEFDELSCSDIVTQLNLPHDHAVLLLHSLACSKYKILDKMPSNQAISPSDKFRFNFKFSDKMRRIKVPPPRFATNDMKIVAGIENDRRYTIDATIVRIMKSRKTMSHTMLVAECTAQLSNMFMPDMAMIKKRIEDLINREYMERDLQAPSTYNYLA